MDPILIKKDNSLPNISVSSGNLPSINVGSVANLPQIQINRQQAGAISQPSITQPSSPQASISVPKPASLTLPPKLGINNEGIQSIPEPGDIPGIKNALNNIDNYQSPTQQAQIVQRAADAGLIERQHAGKIVNYLLQPNQYKGYKEPSGWSELKTAVNQSVVPIATLGTSYLADKLGTNLGNISVLKSATKPTGISPNAALATAQQTEAEQGTPIVDEKGNDVGLGKTAKNVVTSAVGDAIQAALAAETAGTSQAIEAGVSRLMPNFAGRFITDVAGRATAGGILGAGFNVAGGASAGEPLTAKNIFQNAKSGAIIGAVSGAPVGFADYLRGGEVAPEAAQNMVETAKSGQPVGIKPAELTVVGKNVEKPSVAQSEPTPEATAAEEANFPRNADAERAAINEYAKSGDIQKATEAYHKVSGRDLQNSLSETTTALQDAKMLTHEGELPAPFGIQEFPVTKEPEGEAHAPIKERAITKLGLRETRLSKSASGREFVQRVKNRDIVSNLLQGRMEEGLSVFHLSPQQVGETFDVVEGKAKSIDPAVNQAAAELQQRMPEVLKALRMMGEKTKQIPNYMPHEIPESYFKNKANYNRIISGLVQKGIAKDANEARQILNEYRYENSDNSGGALDNPREFNIPEYNKTAGALHNYFQRAARRIATRQAFGKYNQVLDRLETEAARRGEDASTLRRLMDEVIYGSKRNESSLGKIGSGVRGVTSFLQLQKAFISHLPQGFQNTGAEVGLARYFRAVKQRVFNSADQQYNHEVGIDTHQNLFPGARGKVIAPLINNVLQFHREVASIAGRNFGEFLARKGDETALRDLGATGDFARNEDGSINLTDTQRAQLSHEMANRTIGSHSPLQRTEWAQGELGKYIGQYREAYVFKQAQRINSMLKRAAHGDVAPILRYLVVAAPVSGVVVTAGKNVFTSGNPKPSNESWGNFLLSSLYNSGGLSLAGGLADDAYNMARYHYNRDMVASNLASDVAPSAGTATETGQNVDNALRGNSKALVKQGLSYMPGGKVIQGHIYPTKVVSSKDQQFYNAWNQNYPQFTKSLNPAFGQSANPTAIKTAERTRNIATTYISKNHDPSGNTILLNSYETAQNDGLLASDPKAMAAVQKLEKSLPGHNPMWDLPSNQLAVYLVYKSYPPGDPNVTVLEQKNPWIINQFAKESAWASSIGQLSNTIEGPGYVPYPNITPQQSQMMSQVSQLAQIQNRTPAQETQLTSLENNPQLRSAFAMLDKYTNDRRATWPNGSLQPIPYPAAGLTPAQSALLQQESALPKGTRGAFIRANQDAWNAMEQVLAQNTLYNVEKYGGVVQQGGTEPNLLKDIYNLGKYDIAMGSSAGGENTYVLNPALAYSGGSKGGFSFGGSSGSGGGSSKSKKKPFVPRPRVKFGKHEAYVRRPPHAIKVRKPHPKKTSIHIHAKTVAKPVRVAKKVNLQKMK